MIQGSFGSKGELYFEIDLIAADGSLVTVDAMLDTGFTDWLAMDIQDIESLEWLLEGEERKQTARGEAIFNRYSGGVIVDNQEFAVPVLGGEGITEILIGLPWLENRRLVVDRKAGILTLGEE